MNDHCTINNCGEPATHWKADQPAAAWCAPHTPTVTEAAYNCRLCTFLGHTTTTLIDHYYSHARSWRDEALLVERRRQADRRAALDRIAALRDVLTEYERVLL